MKRGRLIAAALLAAAAVPAPAAPPAAPAQVAKDWTRTVAVTPEGGFRMGNPAAKLKLVEYGSLTCGHCAAFAEEAGEALRDRYVRSGTVSFEFRPFLLFPTDVGTSLLLQCRGPASFFQLSHQLYAEQAEWAGKVRALPEADLLRLSEMQPADQAAALVRLTGIDALFRSHGMTEGDISACLKDEAGLERLARTSDLGASLGVQGTPTFFLNGKMLDVNTWPQIEPLIRQAGG
jgi:protein-disulfide isomerase